MRRISVPELLDSDEGTPQEIADSLEDLRRINRFLGGYSTTRKLLQRAAAKKNLANVSYLDVGGASSASPEMSELTVLDRDPGHLRLIGTRRVCGDAFNLPFREGSFD